MASAGEIEQAVLDLRQRVAAATLAKQWSDVARLFQQARGTLAESEVTEALGAHVQSLPDSLRIQLAQVWITRGEPARAIELLSLVEDPGGLVLLADLLRDGLHDRAPERADLERAYALYGRALRADWDAPGVHERWERLGLKLGLRAAESAPGIGATLVAKGPALPFTLLREVARGGTGTVYEAREELGGVRRHVALKIAHDPQQMREQLVHEARVAVQFRGPGVVRVHDVDPVAGWLALEWLGGGSLARPQVTFDPIEALETLRGVLNRIHAAGWVHGDVKPSNVLLDERGHVVLADFGLSRPIGAPNTPGTVGFRSQPRIDGAPCAPIDDLHALACVEAQLSRAQAEGRLD